MALPAIPILAGAGALLGRIVAGGMRMAGAVFVLKLILLVLLKLVLVTIVAPILFFLFRLGVKLALLVVIYQFFTGWLIYRAYDVLQSALTLLPGPGHHGLTRFWQLVEATREIFPWDDFGLLCKWVVIILLWVTLWRYIEWVWHQSVGFIKWVFA